MKRDNEVKAATSVSAMVCWLTWVPRVTTHTAHNGPAQVKWIHFYSLHPISFACRPQENFICFFLTKVQEKNRRWAEPPGRARHCPTGVCTWRGPLRQQLLQGWVGRAPVLCWQVHKHLLFGKNWQLIHAERSWPWSAGRAGEEGCSVALTAHVW